MRLLFGNRPAPFEQAILPHLNAAYNLARWLTRNDQDAEDIVQEACLKAFTAWQSFRGGDCRAWLLTIVRNTCFSWLQRNRRYERPLSLDEDLLEVSSDAFNPEAILLQTVDTGALHRAIEELPLEFREAIVLRELEGLAYREIAEIVGIPIGTVMSRLARARKRLQQSLTSPLDTREDRHSKESA